MHAQPERYPTPSLAPVSWAWICQVAPSIVDHGTGTPPLGWTWWSLSSPHTECLHRGQVITRNGPGPPEYHLGAPKIKIGKKKNEMLGKVQGIGIAAQGG